MRKIESPSGFLHEFILQCMINQKAMELVAGLRVEGLLMKALHGYKCKHVLLCSGILGNSGYWST